MEQVVNGKFPLAKTGEREIHMKMVVKIEKNGANGDLAKTVNTRELHQFLGVGKMFANWIKDRIEQYNFIENLDYGVIPNFGNNLSGGRPSKEYAISIDLAKTVNASHISECYFTG